MSVRSMVRGVAGLVVAVGLATAASAQTDTSPVQTQPGSPGMPAPGSTVPDKAGSTGSTGTLSDRLERSGGVITPPSNIDPGMTAAAPVPNPGTTPVITVPGSPGGNQSVQPK